MKTFIMQFEFVGQVSYVMYPVTIFCLRMSWQKLWSLFGTPGYASLVSWQPLSMASVPCCILFSDKGIRVMPVLMATSNLVVISVQISDRQPHAVYCIKLIRITLVES